jgi:ubiquinone/menaquinone biosynthesis C-methylase UbiE
MDSQTIKTYNQLAKEYDEETTGFWDQFPVTILDHFTKQLSGKRVLDIGSGPGRDGILLQNRGLEVTCLDASSAMVRMCQERGLTAIEGDLLDLGFDDTSFDGAWAYTSLLHIKKSQLECALSEIHRVLTQDGTLGLGMIEGGGEQYRESSGVGLPRLFAYYSEQELESVLQATGFKTTYTESFTPRSKRYLHFVCKKAK